MTQRHFIPGDRVRIMKSVIRDFEWMVGSEATVQYEYMFGPVNERRTDAYIINVPGYGEIGALAEELELIPEEGKS